MYNRYIPAETSYTAIETGIQASDVRRERPAAQIPPMQRALFSSKDTLSRLLGGENGGAGKLLKACRLDRFDSGDLLVLLIVLLLLSEGDEWDPVIALGVFLLLELTESRDKEEK